MSDSRLLKKMIMYLEECNSPLRTVHHDVFEEFLSD